MIHHIVKIYLLMLVLVHFPIDLGDVITGN